MMRSIGLLCPAAIAILCGGCIAPAVITGVDPDLARIAAPTTNGIVRFPLDTVAIEEVAPPPPVENATPLALELQRVTRTIIDTQPAEPATTQLGTLQHIKSIREISLDISPPQLADYQQLAISMPRDFAAEALPLLAQQQPFTRGDLAYAGFDWHPAVNGLTFCYQPLYFEEVNLERYGRAHGIVQPFVSAAAFYGRIPALPYMAFARPARRCTDHAHWTLPGYKIPQREPQPLVPSIHGAAAEVAVLYGIILLIP